MFISSSDPIMLIPVDLDEVIRFSIRVLFWEFWGKIACLSVYQSFFVVHLLSHVWLFATPWTVACQAPLSIGFSREEYWDRLPFPPPWDLRLLGDTKVCFQLIYLFLAALSPCYCPRAFSSCGVPASHCSGFSCCGVWAVGCGLSICVSWT